MSKMIVAFLAIFAMVFLIIQGVVDISGREKLQLAKALGYSFLCAALALAIAVGVVILF
jgi:nucleoside permease NupC